MASMPPPTYDYDVKAMQSRLGVTADGIIGPGTLGALFKKVNKNSPHATELGFGAVVHFVNCAVLHSGLRLSHCMGQLAHESDHFATMEEYASGSAYEGRKDLGNTQPGDGKRYKGRGPIQITGRANYRTYGKMFGIDGESHPELLLTPSIGLLFSMGFWTKNGLNSLADKDDILGITKRINGGTNGLDQRKQLVAQYKKVIIG